MVEASFCRIALTLKMRKPGQLPLPDMLSSSSLPGKWIKERVLCYAWSHPGDTCPKWSSHFRKDLCFSFPVWQPVMQWLWCAECLCTCPSSWGQGVSLQTLWEAVKCQLLGEMRPWSSEIYFAPLFQFQQMHVSPLLWNMPSNATPRCTVMMCG